MNDIPWKWIIGTALVLVPVYGLLFAALAAKLAGSWSGIKKVFYKGRIQITDIHREDSYFDIRDSVIGMKFTPISINETKGLLGWWEMDVEPDCGISYFYAVKYKWVV